MSVPQLVMDEALFHFSGREDPGSEVSQKHPLPSGIVIVLLAILAHAGGPTEIALVAGAHPDFVRELSPLPKRSPRKDVFRRVLCDLKPAAVQACFLEWRETLRSVPRQRPGSIPG